jgi:hypothetical protein
MVDGTVNVTINLPEYCIDQAKTLLGWIGEQATIVITKDARPADDELSKLVTSDS